MIPDNFTELGVRLPILISLIGLIPLATTTALLVVKGRAVEKKSQYRYVSEGEGWFTASIATGTIAGIFLIALTINLFPYQSHYWKIYELDTHVTNVSNVINESNGDLTRTPVLELENIDRPVTMNDPRAVNLKDRDVTLTCTIGWHYQAADTYDCEIRTIH